MKSTTLLTLLSAAASLTAAAPTSAAEAFGADWIDIPAEEVQRRMAGTSVEKRQVGNIYLCTGENYTGTCGAKVQPVCYSGQCQTRTQISQHCVGLGSPYLRNIGSFGPDQGQTVYLSTNGDCNEAESSIQYPGSGQFFEYSNGIGHRITNFLIYAN